MKNNILIIIMLLIGWMTASAQQKIVETQYFKSNPTLGGDVTIEQSTKEIKGKLSYTTFEVNTLKNGLYHLNMWILPSQLADGTVSSYEVKVNGVTLKTEVTPESGDIQSYMLKEKVVLKGGKNTISFITKAPEVAEIEFIRLSTSQTKAFISSEMFDRYMAEIKAVQPASTTKLKIIGGNQTGQYPKLSKDTITLSTSQPTITTLGATSVEPLYSYGYTKLNVKYTYYRTVSLTAGQSFFVATNGVNGQGHILELFSATNPEDYSWSTHSSNALASLNLTIPVTGMYYVKVRSNRNAELGYVNININGQYYYENVPAYSIGYAYGQDTEREYNTFTTHSTSDPRIWIERYASDNLIVAFNDDWSKASNFSWGTNSRIKQYYKRPVNAVLVSAYGSSNPAGQCELYVGCRNSTVYPWFENLKADDAIMSAPETNRYNCISWAGGITEFWEWPDVPFSKYYQESLLAAFDAFYGGYRYGDPRINPNIDKGKCTLYTRSGATETNSLIDLWAEVNGSGREYTHASVSGEANGHHHGYDWESKPGGLMRTFHPRYALKGNTYGQVVEHYRPIATAQPYSFAESIADGTSVLENVEFTSLEKAILKAQIDNMALSEKSTFETKYAAWKATWTAQPYSNPHKYENSKFMDLLNYCKAHQDLNYLIYNKLGEGDFFNMLLVDKLTLTGNVVNNQVLNNIKISNNNNMTTSAGATIVRSPYSNSMLYVKKLISGVPRMIPLKSLEDNDDGTTGISYSNTDDVTIFNTGADIHIRFSLSDDASVSVSVLELSGIEIKPVISERYSTGEYNFTTRMDQPGIYLVRVGINGNVNIKKVTIK